MPLPVIGRENNPALIVKLFHADADAYILEPFYAAE
jgi:hypothetical protein